MAEISKKELTSRLALSEDLGTDASASRVLTLLIDTIKSELQAGNSVQISGLGKFSPALQKGKTGTVPGTTKSYTTQDKMVPKFKFAAPFKDAIAG